MSKIYPPKVRRDFERLIIKLGYKDRSPICLKTNRETTKIAKECFPISISYIEFFAIHYTNKKSYVYEQYLIDRKILSKKDITKKYKYLLNKIKFSKGRISEIGWQIMWDRHPSMLTKNQHKKILYRIIRELKDMRDNRKYFTIAYPNQVLVSKPWGNQLYNPIDSEDDFDLVRKRSLMNSKFGFGNLDEYGHEYAIFDDTLYLNPI
jgi:hypothetical protein